MDLESIGTAKRNTTRDEETESDAVNNFTPALARVADEVETIYVSRPSLRKCLGIAPAAIPDPCSQPQYPMTSRRSYDLPGF
jgi:hypothetical protein